MATPTLEDLEARIERLERERTFNEDDRERLRGVEHEVQELRMEFVEFRAQTNGRFQSIEGSFQAVDARLEAIDERFAQVDSRFEHVDSRFDQVDARFEHVDSRFAQVDARFEHVDSRFDQVDARFEHVDSRFDQVDARFDQIDARLDRQDARMDALEKRIDALQKELTEFRVDFQKQLGQLEASLTRQISLQQRWMIGLAFSLLAGLALIFVRLLMID